MSPKSNGVNLPGKILRKKFQFKSESSLLAELPLAMEGQFLFCSYFLLVK